MERRQRLRLIFGGLGVLAVALAAWAVLHKPRAKAKGRPAVAVTVAKATAQDVPISVNALGAAQAWKSDTILAQVTGILLSVNFTEGSNVKAGQLLAQIDPALYQAALNQAQGQLKHDQAALADAQLDLKRYQTLLAQQSIASQQVDTQAALVKQDEGTVQVDQANVQTADVNLGRTRITSPINGRAGVRLIDPGNLVNATASATSSTTTATVTGTTSGVTGIVVINQIEPIAVTFSVPQAAYQRLVQLSDGFRKPLVTQALSQETGQTLGTGELTIADNHVDPSTGTVEMKARFPNQGDVLLPGQFVNVRLTLQTLAHATTIPATAVNQGPNGAFVYVVGAGNKVAMQPIKVAVTQGATAVIGSGLAPGATVVTDGQMALAPGMQVKVATPGTPPGAGGNSGPGAGSSAKPKSP